MGFRGGGAKLTPPQRILVFKYPSRDRVNPVYKIRISGENPNNNYFNYFTGKRRGIYFIKGLRDQFCLQTFRAQQGVFLGKIGQGNPWLSKIFNFPKQELFTILSSFEKENVQFFSGKNRRAGK